MADKVLITKSKLDTLANTINAKAGTSGGKTIDQMAQIVQDMSGQSGQLEAIMPPTELPDYVREEVSRVATEARKYITDDSIVFLAMSDGHYYAAEGSYSQGLQTNASNIHAAMAMKALTYLLPVDFVAHLGDFSWGSAATTPIVLKTQIDGFVRYLQEASANLPVFFAIGNHDPGIYYHEAQTDGQIYTLPGDYMYEVFTAKSASENTVFGDTANGGYCYRDFPDKKLRVFLLNTSDSIIKNQDDAATLGSQRVWFANALLDLNSKEDATSWSWILLCHYPADYGGTMPLSELLKAYIVGESITITDENGSSTTANFSGKNAATMIAQFHGHVHNFLVSKLHSYATGSAEQYDAYRVCIPNAQYNRENYYTTVGDKTDISFADPVSYLKTADTAQDTTFVVNIINPTEKLIYSICYGAGVDRTIGYMGADYYRVSKSLVEATIDNNAASVKAGEPYYANVTPNTDFTITTVKVLMGGEDITDQVWSGEEAAEPDVYHKVTVTGATYCTVVTPTQVINGGSLYAVVTPADGYEITNIKVLMGGADISSGAVTYQTDT